MTLLYDPAVLLDPSCFSFSHSPSNSLSDSEDAHNQHPANPYLYLPRLPVTSLTTSNQDAIMFAATQAAAPAGQIPSSVQLARAIAAELKGNVIEAGFPFIDRLFPETRAPFRIDKKVFVQLQNKALFDRNKNSFIVPPDFEEATLCRWLNDIGQAMALASGIPLKRRWWYGAGTLPPGGSDSASGPNLVLLDQDYYDNLLTSESQVNWLLVRSFAEVTSERMYSQQMGPMIDAKSYVMSTYQLDRRFVLALSLVGSSEFALTLTDREGQIRFQGTALSGSNRENASIFLRILCFFMFGKLSDIGLDPAFISDLTTGQLTAVMVGDRCFQLFERIHAKNNMLGRSTKVWVVTSDNEKFLMKDSWVEMRGGPSEVEHLTAMLGHEKIKGFVPTIICGGDVTIDGEKDCTSTYRTHVLGGVHGRRIHCRIVTTPVGEALTTFKSKKELIGALIDTVRTHDYLTNKLQILHRDISIGNIMLSRQDSLENASGLLIDFDCSERLGPGTKNLSNSMADAEMDEDNSDEEMDEDDSDEDIRVHERILTGTLPFMAIEVLINFDKTFGKRSACHDLESLLYVILYVCTYTCGPGKKRKEFPAAMTIPLVRWFEMDYIRDIGRTKLGHIITAADTIISKFDDYWSDFIPFVEELIKTCFPTNPTMPNQLTHANVLAILERAIAAVQDDVDDHSHIDNRKRPLEGNSGVPPAKKGRRK